MEPELSNILLLCTNLHRAVGLLFGALQGGDFFFPGMALVLVGMNSAKEIMCHMPCSSVFVLMLNCP